MIEKNTKGTLAGKHADIDALIGANLRFQRELAGFSQEGIAKKLGISFQQIQKYEKGKSRIACSTLYRISLFLDVPLLEFFEGLSYPYKPRLILSKADMEIAFLYQSLPHTLKRSAKSYLKSFRKT